MIVYAKALEKGGKYPLMIWPEHCVIGTPGHNIQATILAALQKWERDYFATVNFVTKGTNTFVEHYGALLAEVPLASDPTTGLRTDVLDALAAADVVGLAGEASSHCDKETITQIADHIGEKHIKKFHILTDCMSPVAAVPGGPDFPAIAAAWLKDMEARGMTLTTSDKFLS
jgi:nicotinamidase-related amidase